MNSSSLFTITHLIKIFVFLYLAVLAAQHSVKMSQILVYKFTVEFSMTKKKMFPPGIEPGTFRVLGGCDNHYTTETSWEHGFAARVFSRTISLNYLGHVAFMLCAIIQSVFNEKKKEIPLPL